jgi:broad specificity phosphatase PhoE
MKKAAIYIRGRVILGNSHLDAFEKLSQEERLCNSITNGFFDTETGEFEGHQEEDHFFHKELLMFRHAHVEDQCPDPPISDLGISQIHKNLQYLNEIDLKEFIGICSPMLRCLQTAEIIQENTGLHFRIEPELIEPPPFLQPGEEYFVPARYKCFPFYEWETQDGWVVRTWSQQELCNRITNLLRSLPLKCIIVSHTGIIVNIVRMALCEKTSKQHGIPTASLTHLVNREVRCLGKIL